jgi:hypothetical protein
MFSHQLIEDYLSGSSVGLAVDNALSEVTIKQIKKQKPWMVPVIEYLVKQRRVKPKYIPFITFWLDDEYGFDDVYKEYTKKHPDLSIPMQAYFRELPSSLLDYMSNLIGLAERFEYASKRKKIDQAIKIGLVKNKQVKDITFWSKTRIKPVLGIKGPTLKTMHQLLNRLSALKSRSDFNKLKSTKDIDIVYQDERFFVARPITKEASCALGKGMSWCITLPTSDYFNEYSGEGKVFVFIIDRFASDDNYWKVAVEGEIDSSRFTYWDSSNTSFISDNALSTHYGKDNWSKIGTKVFKYLKGLDWSDLKGSRPPGTLMPGDSVTLNSNWFYNMEQWLDEEPHGLDAWRLMWNHGLRDALSYADGEVIGPEGGFHYDDNDPHGEVKFNFHRSWEWFYDNSASDDEPTTLPVKPPNPLKSAQQWFDFPAAKAEVAAQYTKDLEKYDRELAFYKAYKEIEKMIDDTGYTDAYMYWGDLDQ